MPIDVKTFDADVPANARDYELGSLSPARGEEFLIQETGYYFTGSGRLYAYVNGVQTDNVSHYLAPDKDHRVLRNTLLTFGMALRFAADDYSGSTNRIGVIVVYDRRPAG